MSRFRERFEQSSGARNLIQNPELVRSVRNALGLRQEHITPTLNEGMQAVLIAGDLTKTEAAVANPCMVSFVTACAGAATQILMALCNPRGNPASAAASTVRLTNIALEMWTPGGTTAQRADFYLQRRATLDLDWGASPRTAFGPSYVDTQKYPGPAVLGAANNTNSDLQSIQNPGDLGTPSLSAFIFQMQAFAITTQPRLITFPGLVLDPGWCLTWRNPTAGFVVPNGFIGNMTYNEELIQ